MDLFKTTAGYIKGAAGDYISESFPVTGSIVNDAKSTIRDIQTKLGDGQGMPLVQRIMKMKKHVSAKKIFDWYTEKENDFDDFSDDELTFDGATPEEGEDQKRNAALSNPVVQSNEKVAKTVVESSHKMAEATIAATANIISSIDKQTAIITAGFDRTNDTLNSILEVITKNTSTLVELASASRMDQKNESRTGSNNDMLSGKFSLSKYKKMVAENFQSTELGMMYPMMSMMFSMGKNFGPQEFISMAFGQAMNHFAPKMKQNMQALDNAVGEVILNSLVRLGEKKHKGGILGQLATIFGISAEKERVDTSRPSLEVKNVSFDSLTRESIVHTIPGYLRQILKTLSGRDITYDPRTRSFKGANHIQNEYNREVRNAVTGNMHNADERIQKKLDKNEMSSMLYDLLISHLGNNVEMGESREMIKNFKDKDYSQELVKSLVEGVQLSTKEILSSKEFANMLGEATEGDLAQKMFNQVIQANRSRKEQLQSFVDNMKKYDMDISMLNDDPTKDLDQILKANGKKGNAEIRVKESSYMTGVNYTNMALYEIYRRLNEGINVYQVGKGRHRRTPYTKFGDDYLKKPKNYRAKSLSGDSNNGYNDLAAETSNSNKEDTKDDEQNQESLSSGERFSRWGKNKWGKLSKAFFSGSPAEVKGVFVEILNDVKDTAFDKFKEASQKVNDSFGNVTGYLKHKIFGSAYSYQERQEDGSYKTVNIKENEKGGLFGFVKDKLMGGFKAGKNYAMEWFKEVKGYFNYGDDKDTPSSTVANRKKFMMASVGAYIGSGLLGGPIGLLMGSIGGLALSTTGMGDKLKKLLFGDKEKGTAGLIRKFTDKIFDPIRYEVGKTLKRFSTRLKKNILGPLSDLGFAIKDRITSSIAKVAESRFGKVFSFIGKVLMSPFKGLLGIAKFPFQLMGAVTRGVMGAGMGTAGTTMGGLAQLIATSEGRAAIRERRNKRNQNLDKEFEDDYSLGFKKWKEKQDAKRAQEGSELVKYTEEVVDNTAQLAEDMHEVKEEATHKGSLYTHDQGLHDRIDQIIDVIKSKFTKGKSDSSSSFASNSVDAAMGTATADDGVVTNEEAKLTRDIIDESAKDTPYTQKIANKLKALLGIQKNRKEEDGTKKEKEKSIFEKIADFLGNLSPTAIGAALVAALAGWWATQSKDFATSMNNMGNRIASSLKDLAVKVIFGDDKDKPWWQTNNDVADVMMSPFDMKMRGPIFYPQGEIAHTLTDAAGNDIHNVAATRAMNTPLYDVIRQRLTANANAYRLDNQIRDRIRNATLNGTFGGYNPGRTQTLELIRQRNEILNGGTGASGTILGKFNTFSRGIALGGIAGGATSYATSEALQAMGLDEQYADIGGRIAGVGAQYQVTKGVITGKGMAATALEKLNTVIADLPSYLSKIPLAGKYITKGIESDLVKELKVIGKKLTLGLLAKAGEKVAVILGKAGINVAAGTATGGVVTAGLMAGGGFMQSMEAANLFQVREDDVDDTMRVIGAIVGALFNFPIVTLLDLLDIVLVPISGLSVRQWLSKYLYQAINGSAELSEKQTALNQEKDEYNQKFGTNLDTATYNDMTNQTIFDDIMKGSVKRDENGNVQFNDDGSVKHGIGAGDLVNVLFGERQKDENGKTIYDENGIPKVNGMDTGRLVSNGLLLMNPGTWPIAIGRVAMEYLTDYLDSDDTPWKKEGKDFKTYVYDGVSDMVLAPFKWMKETTEGIVNWYEKDSPWGQKGQTISYWAGTKVMDIIFDTFEFFDKTIDGIKKWYNEDSPWGKEGKTPTEYASQRISEIPGRVEKFFTDMKDGIIHWYEEDSPWAKDDKTLGEWVISGFEYPFVKLSEFTGSIRDGIVNWYEKDSPWGKEGKTPVNWAIDSVSSIFGGIANKVQELANSLKNISVTDLIKKGITTLGDYASRDNGIVGSTIQFGKGLYDAAKKRFDERNKNKGSGGVDILPRGGGEYSEAEMFQMEQDTYFKNLAQTRAIEEAKTAQSSGKRPAPLSSSYTMTSDWGWRIHPVHGTRSWHTGVDLAPDDPEASVISVFPGKVIEKFDGATGEDDRSNGGWGNSIVLDIGNGFTNRYAHMLQGSVSSSIKEGDTIPAGTILGTVGSTGTSTGTHLHFQMNEDGVMNEGEKSDVDPKPYLEGAEVVPGAGFRGSSSGKNGSGASGSNTKKPKGPLAAFIDQLKGAAVGLLDGVTGGLFSTLLPTDDDGSNGPGSSAGASAGMGIGATTMSGKQGAEVANMISKKTGLPAEWIWAQMMLETGRFDPSNPLVTEDHNYAGIKAYGDAKQSRTLSPASEGSTPYRHFDSDEEYAEYQASNLKAYADDGIFAARNVDEFAEALKRGGYFGGDLEDYKANLRSLVKEAKEGGMGGGSGGIEEARTAMMEKFGIHMSKNKKKLRHIGGPDRVSPMAQPYEVSSPFGPRGSGYHYGVDLVTAGDLPEDSDILSTVHGKVYFADGSKQEGDTGANGQFGNLVQIDDGQWLYSYAHLKQGSVPPGIREGATVNPGDKIGEMGNTGHSLGQHLHFQVNPDTDESSDAAVDPMPFLEGAPTVAGQNPNGAASGISGASGNKAGKTLGPFAQFLNSIKGFGNEYLSKISGGLIGDTGSAGAAISSSQGSSGATFTGLSGNDNAQKAFNFFIKKGLSPAAAAGIIGNFMQESGCDPSKHQVGGPAQGIAQWEGARLQALYAFAESQGKPWDDLETQLEFLWQELNTDDMNARFNGLTPETWTPTGYSPLSGGFNEFKSLTDYKHATAAFEAAFERAGTPVMENRFAAAEEAFNSFGNGSTAPQQKTGTGGGNRFPKSMNKRKHIGGPSLFTSKTLHPSYDVNHPDSPISKYSNSLSGTTGEGKDNTENLLRQVLQELKEINGHTENSSELLGSLNEKDFVDNGVRNSIKALGKSAKPNYGKPNNYNSARSIRNLIRP